MGGVRWLPRLCQLRFTYWKPELTFLVPHLGPAGLVRSHADLLWKIHFRGSPQYLLLAIEFQSASDPYMSVRILYYVAAANQGCGMRSLTCATGRANLYRRRTSCRGLRAWNWIPRPRTCRASYGKCRGSIPERSTRGFAKRSGNGFWEPRNPWGIGEETLQRVESLKEAEMIYAGVEELKERAHREGLGRGRATLVHRQARLKFGAETAEQLSKLLDGITDPEQIARIGDRIIECETGAELLARARED